MISPEYQEKLFWMENRKIDVEYIFESYLPLIGDGPGATMKLGESLFMSNFTCYGKYLRLNTKKTMN